MLPLHVYRLHRTNEYQVLLLYRFFFPTLFGMTWKNDESMMPMCYCCPLPTGLHFINGIMFLLCVLDTVIENAFLTANILGGSSLGIPRNGEIGIVWGYTAITTFVGSSALSMAPSKKKGMFIKIWRAMLLGFMLLWTVRLAMSISQMNKWAWEREENKRDETKKGSKPFFYTKLFEVIQFALRWFIFDSLSFPENIAYFSVKHWGILAWYAVIVPLCAFIVSISYINEYLRATENGELQIITGLVKRRDLRKRKQQERIALLATQSRPESPSNL